MIRVYLDWNVISNLKQPAFAELNKFLFANKDFLLFPYSPAHFSDVMKSHTPNNPHFATDLENLEKLSENHLIRWEETQTKLLIGTPSEYFEEEKNSMSLAEILTEFDLFSDPEVDNDNILDRTLKALYQSQPMGFTIDEHNEFYIKKLFPHITNDSTMWELQKDIVPFMRNLLLNRDYYKDLRNLINHTGISLEANAGNWDTEEVIDKIDSHLQKTGLQTTFLKMVEASVGSPRESRNNFIFFTSAYLMLDMFGYKRDKLHKPTDNMLNIQTDAEHAFYSAHCDFFIVGDKNLRKKSEVLYKKLNLKTIVLAPMDAISHIDKAIHKIPEKNWNFINEVYEFVSDKFIIDILDFDPKFRARRYIIDLPFSYFNFFNKLGYYQYKKPDYDLFYFQRLPVNLSNFSYYSEVEKLIDTLGIAFGIENQEKFDVKKHEFVHQQNELNFKWVADNIEIRLDKHDTTQSPTLSYIFKLPE